MFFLKAASILFSITVVYSLSESNHKIVEINEENWDQLLKGEWMVEFFAPWCPACNSLQKKWEEFSILGEDLSVSVAQVDITISPGLSGRFMVTALPTIFHVVNGEFRKYTGPRDKDAFSIYIEEKQWKDTDAIPSWKSPSSFQMSAIAYFFTLSQLLRDTHNVLLKEYGLPSWVSYLLFAVTTIIVGAILGLAIVCVFDYFYPPKQNVVIKEIPKDDKKDSGEDTDDELAREEIVDEENTANSENSSTTRKRKPRKEY